MLSKFGRTRGVAPLRRIIVLALGTGLLALGAFNVQAQIRSEAEAIPARGDRDAGRGYAPAARPVEPSVFGTVALPAGTTPTSARWTRIMAARVDQPALSRLTAEAGKLDRQRQAAFVHSAVNRAVQRRMPAGCRHDDGYWASAEETLGQGQGDCVDIAVAKMEALRRLGFAGHDLYLTTGRVAGGGQKSALLVRIGETFWLLDDRSEQMIAASNTGAFQPALTYGVGMTWAHGRRVLSASSAN